MTIVSFYSSNEPWNKQDKRIVKNASRRGMLEIGCCYTSIYKIKRVLSIKLPLLHLLLYISNEAKGSIF